MLLSPRSFWALLGAGLLLLQAAAFGAPQIVRITTLAGAVATAAAPGDELLIAGAGFGSTTGEIWLDRGGYGEEAAVLEWNGAGGLIRARLPALADPGALRLIVRTGDEGSPGYPLLLTQPPATGSQASAPSAPASPVPPSPPAPAAPSPPAPPAALPPPPGTPADPEVRAVYVLGGTATSSGIAGTRVLVSGARLGSSGVLSFNGVAAGAITVWASTYIVATLPNAPGTGPVTVRRDLGLPDEAWVGGPLFTILPAPAVTGYARGNVPADHVQSGDQIVIQGSNLGTGGQVIFQGIALPVQSWSPQGIVVIAPHVTGTGPLVVVLNPRTGAEVRAQGPALTVTAMD